MPEHPVPQPAVDGASAPLLALTAVVHALLAHMTESGSIVAVERVYEHAQREVANGSDDAGVRAGAVEHLERIMEGNWESGWDAYAPPARSPRRADGAAKAARPRRARRPRAVTSA